MNEKISFREFEMALSMGREIEFSLGDIGYFISRSESQHTIYNVNKEEIIYEGSVENILDFAFETGVTLKRDFEKFKIAFIL